MKMIRFAGLFAIVMFSAFPAVARIGDMQEAGHKSLGEMTNIREALTQWSAAVESRDVNKIMALYDKHAVMISTFVQNPMTTRADITAYFKRVVSNPDVKVMIEDAHPRIFGTTGVISGRYTLSYTQDGEPVTIPARFSFTYVQENGKWMIVDQHSSRVPLPQEK